MIVTITDTASHVFPAPGCSRADDAALTPTPPRGYAPDTALTPTLFRPGCAAGFVAQLDRLAAP